MFLAYPVKSYSPDFPLIHKKHLVQGQKNFHHSGFLVIIIGWLIFMN
jgi:hypothetical protein